MTLMIMATVGSILLAATHLPVLTELTITEWYGRGTWSFSSDQVGRNNE